MAKDEALIVDEVAQRVAGQALGDAQVDDVQRVWQNVMYSHARKAEDLVPDGVVDDPLGMLVHSPDLE